MANGTKEIKITDITEPSASLLNVLKRYQFSIPSYQRGYKWDKGQVRDLLSDLLSFYNTKIKYHPDSKDYYCLQSLIIKKDSETDRYMVIDGQQRLTTCYILLSYLMNKKNNSGPGEDFDFSNKEDCIRYDSRVDTGECLSNIYKGVYLENDGEKVRTPESRDQKHIFDAYDEIKDILDKDEESLKGITELIRKDSIRFILQELPDDSETNKEIESFEDINTGRIYLTDAELIRANLILSADEPTKISSKWDEIERSLQNDLFWFFIQNKKSIEDKAASRIEYLFEILAKEVANKIKEQDKTEKNNKAGKNKEKDNKLDEYKKKYEKRYIYRFFKDYRFTDRDNVESGNTFETAENKIIFWDRVEALYEIFTKWYSDIELYNYIGIVFYNDPDSICSLYELYRNSNRKAFIFELKKKILRSFVKPNVSIKEIWNIDPDEENVRTKEKTELNDKDKLIMEKLSDICKEREDFDYSGNFIFKTLWYDGRGASGEFKAGVMSFLLWSNCQYLNNQLENTLKTMEDKESILISQEPYRFPFDVFKTRNADIEHVSSYNSKMDSDKMFKDDDQKYEWILNVLEELEDENKKEIIKEIEDRNGNYDFDAFRNKAEELFGDEINIEEDINNLGSKEVDRRRIGNLTLLDKNINRGYGNDPFRLKRKDIIKKSTQGIYVYPCTKLVFLKEFDVKATDLTSWKEADFKMYTRFLADLFYECFCIDDDGSYTSKLLEDAEKDRMEAK